jgi:class 3 adenylate cyclase
MRKFFNDLSIRSKLILLIGGTVCVLTAGVLSVVWFQSLKQVRAIVQDQLGTTRQMFATAQRSHYRAHAFEVASLAASADIVQALEKHDREAACAVIQRMVKAPRPDERDNHVLDYVAIRMPDGSPLAVVAGLRPVCDAQTLSWHLPDVHGSLNGAPEISTWSSPEKGLFHIFAAAVPGRGGPLGSLSIGFEEDDGLARDAKMRAGVDVVSWQEDEQHQAHVVGISDPSLRGPLTEVFDKQPDLHKPFDFKSAGGEYEVEEVVVSDAGMTLRNPAGMHIALVESVSERMKPFRILEEYLGALALAALLLGVGLGFIFSGPIATPLVNLAGAARDIEAGKYEVIEQLRASNAGRLAATDEIGDLSRAFIEMAGGLKQRFAMSKYMSRSAYRMLEQNGAANPDGERKWMVVVFSDVRGFTAFSEDRDPAMVIQRLNDVLGLEADVVRRHGGDVDKFVGDAMFAWFFGPDRCKRAIEAASEILAELHTRFGGKAGTEIGFGIHVGEVVVGSMGSQDRRDYTAIGRSVNLASRLCSAAKAGQILVSQAVATELEGSLPLNALAAVPVKGFPEPVKIFEVELATSKVPA